MVRDHQISIRLTRSEIEYLEAQRQRRGVRSIQDVIRVEMAERRQSGGAK